MNACCSGCSRPSCATPSIVSTAWPLTNTVGVRHALTGSPSSSTVHAPQTPIPQRSWVPVRSSVRRRVSRSRWWFGTSSSVSRPLSVNEMRVVYTSGCAIVFGAPARYVAACMLSDSHSGLTQADAYAIQAGWLTRKLAAGAELVGRKVGLTSQAMQKQLNVHEPDFGFLLRTMLVPSGGTLARAELLRPRVEPEIGFWLARDLRGPGVTVEQVLAATRGVCAAMEIVDSRIADWRIKLVDTIADNGSSARAVFSDNVVPAGDVDLAAERVTLLRNGEPVGEGDGAAVLGHPAEAVAWLANTLATFDQALRAGQVVLPGAMCASVFAEKGEVFEARFTRLGSVTVRFD